MENRYCLQMVSCGDGCCCGGENSASENVYSTEETVCGKWIDGKWYWFDGAGMMVTNTWYKYNCDWYYLGPDGAMCKSQLVENSGKIYAVDTDGKMITEPVKLTPDQDRISEIVLNLFGKVTNCPVRYKMII